VRVGLVSDPNDQREYQQQREAEQERIGLVLRVVSRRNGDIMHLRTFCDSSPLDNVRRLISTAFDQICHYCGGLQKQVRIGKLAIGRTPREPVRSGRQCRLSSKVV
jgi:hypothetical protein